ncbi:MAG: DUF4185 domain-containing protein [Nocardioidaceae bacterium]
MTRAAASSTRDTVGVTAWRRLTTVLSAMGSARPGRSAAVLAVLVVALSVPPLMSGGWGAGTERAEPHRARLAVVAPPLVVAALTRQTAADSSQPFAIIAVREWEPARDMVRRGAVDAAVLVELRAARDTLVVRRGRGGALTDAVTDRLRALEADRGRTVTVQLVGSTDSGTSRQAAVFAVLGLVGGLLLAAAVSVWRGPVPATGPRGAVRIAGLAAAALLIGGIIAAIGSARSLPSAAASPTLTAAMGAGLVLLGALLTVALEAVAGLFGLALAAVVLLVLATPLVTGRDPVLLPTAAARVLDLSPPGASWRAVSGATYLPDSGLAHPLAVLGTWSVLGLLTLVVARRLRPLSRALAPAHPGRWRIQVCLVVGAVAALGLAGAALVPGQSSAHTDPVVLASRTHCLDPGRITDIADLNRVAGRLRGSPAFLGGDVGADVELGDGRRLWLFGDTLRSPTFPGQRLVRNSMLVVGRRCLAVVVPALGGAVIPDRTGTGTSVGYWPMAVGRIGLPGYDLVAVTAQRVASTGSGVFDFANLGPSVAVFLVPAGGVPQLLAQRDIGRDHTDRALPMWGAAAAVSHGWVYLYGTASPGTPGVFGYSLRVARVRIDDLLDVARWRYWDGSRWSTHADRATALIPASGGVSQTLSVFEQDRRWFALSKRNDFLGTDLDVWTAPAPTGPFRIRPPLAHLPSDAVTGELRYMPLAHPDLLPRPGTMVVSYSRNDTDFGDVLDDPLRYRPRFLRVELPRDDEGAEVSLH